MHKDTDPEMNIARVRETLRAAGLRCTTCRIAVVQHLSQATMPQSHGDVAEKLVPEGFDKSTIYRSLIELAEVGLVSRLDLGDHVWRFELRGTGSEAGNEHPHFMCIQCGKVTCLPESSVKIAASLGRRKALGDVTEILLKGHCGDCH